MTPESLLDRVGNLWPDWKPTEEQLLAWSKYFASTKDIAGLDRAVTRHYEGCTYSRPNLATLKGLYSATTQRTSLDIPDAKFSGCAVICYANDNKNKIGQMHPIYVHFNDTPDARELARIATQWLNRCTTIYGGEWRYTTEWTIEQVTVEVARLRREAIPPPPQSLPPDDLDEIPF